MLRRLALIFVLLFPFLGRVNASSLNFDGVSNLANSTVLPATGAPVSFAVWVYPTRLVNAGVIIGLFNSTSTPRLSMTIAASTGVLQLAANDGGTTIISTLNAVTLNAWNLCVGIITANNNRKVILNNDLVNAATSAAVRNPTGIDRFSLGVNNTVTPGSFFQGQLGTTTVWKVGLSDADQSSIYNCVSPMKIQPHKRVFYAPYLGVGSSVLDWSGNDMTITGATANANTPPCGHP